MLHSVFGKALRESRRGVAAWAIGIAAVGMMYAAFYPSMADPAMAEALRAFPPELLEALNMGDLTSPAGYLEGSTFGLLGPLMMIIFATVLGSRAIAGDEEDGRLDVLLAHPVERWSVVVQRGLAMVVALAIAGLVLFVGLVAISGPAQLTEIGAANLAATTVQLVLLAGVFGSLALGVGALTGSRGAAIGAVAIIGVLTYLAHTVLPDVSGFEWAENLSPFFYYLGGRPLVNGLQVADSLVLATTAVVLVAIGVIGFVRRDIAV